MHPQDAGLTWSMPRAGKLAHLLSPRLQHCVSTDASPPAECDLLLVLGGTEGLGTVLLEEPEQRQRFPRKGQPRGEEGSACGPALSRTHWDLGHSLGLGLLGSATRVSGLTVEKLPTRVLVLQSAGAPLGVCVHARRAER